MGRRDFLKQLSVILLASACAFGGGRALKKGSDNSKYVFDAFKGQKHSGYKFSCPLPFSFELIDDVVQINKTYKKSKLETFYGALPDNANPLVGFTSSGRGINYAVQSFNDFAQYVNYAKNRGFNFVYLLNSPRPFTEEDYEYYRPGLEELLKFLKDLNVYNVKVANQQMLEIFKDKPEFNVQASTSLEYTNIRQLQNFLNVYPRVKNVNLAIDTNRNIEFLKNAKEVFGNKVQFEIMVDESCLYGCPARVQHISCNDFTYPCRKYQSLTNSWRNIFRTNIVYPWNLDYYAGLGYKNFKFMGVPYGMRPNTRSVAFVRDYFEAVENGLGKLTINQLFGSIGIFQFTDNKQFTPLTPELIANFPDLNFFIEKGHMCSVNCGSECNYCMECAEKIYKIASV